MKTKLLETTGEELERLLGEVLPQSHIFYDGIHGSDSCLLCIRRNGFPVCVSLRWTTHRRGSDHPGQQRTNAISVCCIGLKGLREKIK